MSTLGRIPSAPIGARLRARAGAALGRARAWFTAPVAAACPYDAREECADCFLDRQW